MLRECYMHYIDMLLAATTAIQVPRKNGSNSWITTRDVGIEKCTETNVSILLFWHDHSFPWGDCSIKIVLFKHIHEKKRFVRAMHIPSNSAEEEWRKKRVTMLFFVLYIPVHYIYIFIYMVNQNQCCILRHINDGPECDTKITDNLFNIT